MRMLRMGLFTVGVFVMAVFTAPVTAAGDKVAICHTSGHEFDALATPGGLGGGWQCLAGEGKVTLIEVSASACQAHLGAACPGSE